MVKLSKLHKFTQFGFILKFGLKVHYHFTQDYICMLYAPLNFLLGAYKIHGDMQMGKK
jgi:hypothetical protein